MLKIMKKKKCPGDIIGLLKSIKLFAIIKVGKWKIL